MSETTLDVLVVAPHPDDAELGMGGGIVKMLDDGLRVGILDLTDGEPTPHGSIETRADETRRASEVLGIAWRENLGLPNRFLEPTLEARYQLAGVFRRVRPRWIFAPYWEDAHPDHLAATQLVDAARFWSKLTKSNLPGEPFHPQRVYNYFCVHRKHVARPSLVLDISEQWERKLEAIRCFHSQFIQGRDAGFLDQFRDEASFWGKTIGTAYGEPYTCREPIGVSSLTMLV